MKNFALIGASGYIAPRHMKAIADTGNRLLAAVDPNDSVGVIDRYFPEARFFTEIERFDRFMEKNRRMEKDKQIDYVSICSPNYLHDAHVRLALRVNAHAICEKPLTISPWNVDALTELEQEYQSKVYTILQLRLLPSLIALREKVKANSRGEKPEVNLSYITRRGPWYHTSWKGAEEKSGGVAMNIGIHFFDLMLWMFGPCERHELHLHQKDKMAGYLELEAARIKWFLSVDKDDLPDGYLEQDKPAYRSMTMNGEEIEFTGFTDLHTECYKDILEGGGFGLSDAKPAVELVHGIRTGDVVSGSKETKHPKLG